MTEVAKQIETKDAVHQIGLKELFVINLCAAMTPMPAVPKQLKGYEKHKLYQISKIEDGRRRYRLRLGFFTGETDAELLLASIRQMYPAALVTCATTEDLRYVSAEQTLTAATPTPTQAPTPIPIPTPAAAAPAPKAVAQPAVAALQLVDPPAAKTAATSSPSPTTDTQIFHVGRGINIPESSLELTADDLRSLPVNVPVTATPAPKPAPSLANKAAAKPAPPAAKAMPTATQPASVAVKPPATSAAKSSFGPVVPPIAKAPASTPAPAPTKPQPTAVVNKPAAAASPSPKPIGTTSAGPIVSATVQTTAKQDDYIPILDTTLTIRTLTKAEAEDPNRPKWFVVQLAHSDRPIDVSTMPKLDIFAAYSLYAVALMEQGGIRHTLRLGFFKEHVSAEAVMGYLKTFFASPSVVQIAAAEHDRFAQGEPRKTPPKTAEPAKQPGTPVKVVPMAAPVAKPLATKSATIKAPVSLLHAENNKQGQGTFLSRLIGKQLD